MHNRRTRTFVAGIGLLGLWTTDARAFAPSDSVFIGIEPQRVLQYDRLTQAELAQQPAWHEFIEGIGQGWQARFDQKAGTPHRMWGPGIELGPVSSSGLASASFLRFAEANAGLFGVDASSLRLRSANYVERLKTWYVDIDVLKEGAPIWRGGITARIKNGRLVMLGADTYPYVPIVNRQVIGGFEAMLRATESGPAPDASHADESWELVVLPEESRGELSLRLCWLIRTRTLEPRGIWISFVDAEDGRLVEVYNEVKFITGLVQGEHDVRTVDGNTTISPMPYTRVTSSDGTVYADIDGMFETAGEALDLVDELDGSDVQVNNGSGEEGVLSITDGEGLWTEDSATQAEIDSYVFLHQIRDWGMAVAPEVTWIEKKLTSNVNLNDFCNAYYDSWESSVNFFDEGYSCNNTGRIADVNHHEWGHGLHDHSIQSGYWDGSLSEGASDVVAFLQTHDPVIAPYFMTNGSGIREVETDREYPRDYGWETHENGLIFGGAMWDLWQILIEEEGEDVGTTSTTAIFTGLLKGGPTIEESYDEAVFADDDDADLGNGTPHYCALIEAFGRHGLGPLGNDGSLLEFVHDPADVFPVGEDHAITATVSSVAPDCTDFSADTASVQWSVNGGDWQEASLTVVGDDVTGAIPEQSEGSFVEYYLTVSTSGGDTLMAGGSINPFSFYVGDVLPVYCETFEESDGGYKHELLDGTEALGADDWQWGFPMGEGGDPSAAYSGLRVWGNNLGDGSYTGLYLPAKKNALTSPDIDTAGYKGVFLSYRRWLTVRDGSKDVASIYANGEPVWENHESDAGTESHIDTQWASHVVDLGELGDEGTVSLAWEMESGTGGNGSMKGGWTMDDVCLYAPSTPDNRLGISDFVASDDEENRVLLTWTNPKYEPLEKIIVVRKKKGEIPTGPEDDKVIFEDDSPEIGTAQSFEDEDAHRGRTYGYAVFAFDGTNWLSYAKDGWNADIGGIPGGGCGCGFIGTSPGLSGIAGTLAGFALLARRRRAK